MLTDLVTGKVLGATALALGLSLLANWWLWNQIGDLNIENGRLEQRATDAEASLAEANRIGAANLTTIATLSTDNTKLVKQHAADEADMARAAKDAYQDRARLLVQLADERRKRDEIYRTNADCGAWGAARVCPAIAERLRAWPSNGEADHAGSPPR